ncbi:MAG: hypothetical protein II879_04210 [Clostridia bacterium]|nr:hypothetical protein [Clostridia bacterium]
MILQPPCFNMTDGESIQKTESTSFRWLGGQSPSNINPQQRHARCEENFCEAELALREQKFIPCAFSAREHQRCERKRRFIDEMKTGFHFIEEAPAP